MTIFLVKEKTKTLSGLFGVIFIFENFFLITNNIFVTYYGFILEIENLEHKNDKERQYINMYIGMN